MVLSQGGLEDRPGQEHPLWAQLLTMAPGRPHVQQPPLRRRVGLIDLRAEPTFIFTITTLQSSNRKKNAHLSTHLVS